MNDTHHTPQAGSLGVTEPTGSRSAIARGSISNPGDGSGDRLGLAALRDLTVQPAQPESVSLTAKPIARERRSRARGRPPDTQPGQSCTDRAPMSSQVPLKKTTPGNGSATEMKVPSATLHECMGSSPGRHPVVSSVNAVAVLGVIHRDINCLRSSEVCSRSKNCNAGCGCSRMLPPHRNAPCSPV